MLVDYQEGTDIYRSFRTFFARSEGYRQRPEATHNPKVVGSNPTPETTELDPVKRTADKLDSLSSRLLPPLCQRV